ncbi:MAG: hypothetical protein HXX13_04445 [Bacteroidetes bacterium]|nr:hypothetical protein [Bacteroidota bacterium]
MKRTAILIICFLAFSSIFAQIQPTSSSPSYRNIFKLSVSMFTRNTFQMGFEHYFNPTTSFLFNAGMNFKDSDYEQTWGVGTEAQLKLHVYNLIKPKSSHMLYFAPFLMNNYEEIQRNHSGVYGYSNIDDTFDAVSAGVIFGWSFSFANRINLDIYTGGGIRKAFNVQDNTYNDGINDYRYSGIIPRLGIDVGFWF